MESPAAMSSASFAGATAEDRRRRRVAGSAADSAAEAATLDKGDAPARVLGAMQPTDLPLRKVISERTWKLGSILAVLGLALAAAALLEQAAEFVFARLPDVSPVMRSAITTAAAAVRSAASTLMMFAAGQLALLIWWVRSRSLSDLEGRYRIWQLVAASLLAVSLGLAVDIVRLWPLLLAASEDFAAVAAPAWLPAPLTLADVVLLSWGLGLLFCLHSEVRLAKGSLGGVWIAAVCWLAAELVRLDLATLAPDWTVACLLTIGEFALFTALLLHARHVVYVSADPPHLIERAARENEDESSEEAGRASAVEEKPKPVKKTKPTPEKKPAAKRPRKAKPAPPPKTEPQPATPEPVAAPEPEPKPEPQPVVASEPDGSGYQFGPDGPDDEMLKGLSKRERRKIRQAWREEQRRRQSEEAGNAAA